MRCVSSGECLDEGSGLRASAPGVVEPERTGAVRFRRDSAVAWAGAAPPEDLASHAVALRDETVEAAAPADASSPTASAIRSPFR